MKKSNTNKEIIVVGDRVLIQPDENKIKTSHGLYLPQGVEEKEKVQSGFVVKIGPGYPLPDPNSSTDEPWSKSQSDIKYLALQAEVGDYVIFLRKSGVEIEYKGEKYIIVPHHSILLIERNNILKNLDSQE
jgi:co-chaperonin GroES (HSP10)